MAALEAGKRAPDIELPNMDGSTFSLGNTLERGPAIVAFFKISCPVCQFTFPYLERIFKAAKGTNVSIVGISQDSGKDTQFFNKQFGITFPVALDDPKGYAASNAYGITNVPTIFYVGQDGIIEISCQGWSKDDMEEIARRVSKQAKLPPIAVISKEESVPAFRAG